MEQETVAKSDSPVDKKSKYNEDVQLGSFSLKEILRNDMHSRLICVHAVRNSAPENERDAVLIAQKASFDAETISGLLSDQSKLVTIVTNDIYKNCEIFLPPELNKLKGTFIFPATAKHVEKYRELDFFMVKETGEDYAKITLPYLEDHKNQFSVQWIYNLLEHKAETERLLFEDDDPVNGFMLFPDLKWNGLNLDCLYISAIVRRQDLKSIRSLTSDHLPLLRNIYSSCCKIIKDKYGVDESQLRIFFHYQPSYYHLHVHIMHLKADPVGCLIGQAHLLQDVIDNIEMKSNYYQEKTILFSLKSNNPLLNLLKRC